MTISRTSQETPTSLGIGVSQRLVALGVGDSWETPATSRDVRRLRTLRSGTASRRPLSGVSRTLGRPRRLLGDSGVARSLLDSFFLIRTRPRARTRSSKRLRETPGSPGDSRTLRAQKCATETPGDSGTRAPCPAGKKTLRDSGTPRDSWDVRVVPETPGHSGTRATCPTA